MSLKESFMFCHQIILDDAQTMQPNVKIDTHLKNNYFTHSYIFMFIICEE